MSRSYRRYPKLIQEAEDYRYLNRQLRHDKLAEIPKGGSYKKHKPHCGWAYRWSQEQASQDWKSKPWIRDRYSYEEWMQYWKRICLRK